MVNNSKSNFNEKVKELDKLIAYFETSGTEFNLDEGIKKYEEAILLVKDIKKSLQTYELKINELNAKNQVSEQE